MLPTQMGHHQERTAERQKTANSLAKIQRLSLQNGSWGRKTIPHHPTLMLDNDGEAASVEFWVQLVESQYCAFISEGDFLNNRGSEEEIVFLSSKDGEPTTRASSNREEDCHMVEEKDNPLGTVLGRPSSHVDIMALHSTKWEGETEGEMMTKLS